MSWRTRNIRRRNKGKRTKRQRGGGPSLDVIITYLKKNQPDDGVSVHMEKKNMVGIAKPILGSFKIKFDNKSGFNILSTLDGFEGDISKTYKYNIQGTLLKSIVIQSTKVEKDAKIDGNLIVIENMKEITDKMAEIEKQKKENEKMESDARIAENNKNIENAKNQEKFKVIRIELEKFKVDSKRDIYTQSDLEILYSCIETYLKVINSNTISKFMDCYDNHSKKTPLVKTNMTKEDAIKKIKTAIDTTSKFTSPIIKGNLQGIVDRLQIEEEDNQKSRFSLDSENDCSDVDICFFIECIKYNDLGSQLVDETGLTISELIEKGSPNYTYLSYISDIKNPDSYVGCVCYSVDKPNIGIKVSNIMLVEENSITNPVYKDLFKKNVETLYGVLVPILNGNKEFRGPVELADKVGSNFKIEEEKDGFATWRQEVVETPKEEESTNKVEEVVETKDEANESTETNKPEEPIETIETKDEVSDKPDEQESTEEKEEVKTEEPIETTETKDEVLDKPEEQEELVEENEEVISLNEPNNEIKIEEIKQPQSTTSVVQQVLQPTPTVVPQTQTQLQPASQIVQPAVAVQQAPIQQSPQVVPQQDALKTKLDEYTKKVKEELKILLDKLKTKYLITPQTGGASSSQIDIVLQKHPELANTNMKQLFETVPDDVFKELGAEDILKTVGESTVKVEPADPFITGLSSEIASIKQSSDVIAQTKMEMGQPQQQQQQQDSITTVPSTQMPTQLTLDALKVSPEMKHPTSGESGKYIFVPSDKVQSTIDFLLSNGCEITTTVL